MPATAPRCSGTSTSSPRAATPARRSSSSATSTTSSSTASSSRRGVSEYLIAPIAVARLHPGDLGAVSCAGRRARRAAPSRSSARKGGVGASTVAHNLALGHRRASSSHLDRDRRSRLAFGTAGLDFNQDPPQGIAEAVFAPERLDANFLDRLLSKCARRRCSLLAAPATLDRHLRPDRDQLRRPSSRSCAPRRPASSSTCRICGRHGRAAQLIGADEIVLVAAPDLANLRNAKVLMDVLRQARPERSPAQARHQHGQACPSAPRSRRPSSPRRSDCESAAVDPVRLRSSSGRRRTTAR